MNLVTQLEFRILLSVWKLLILPLSFCLFTEAAINPYLYNDPNVDYSNHQLDGKAPLTLDAIRERAEKGDVEARRSLGRYYASEDSPEPNLNEAAKWFKLAAQTGDAESENGLGTLYAKGVGIERDSAKAVELFTRAAEKGYGPALINLALCHISGTGVVKNLQLGLDFLHTAIKMGSVRAKYYLAHYYLFGDHRNYVIGYYWLRKATKEEGRPSSTFLFVWIVDSAIVISTAVSAFGIWRFKIWCQKRRCRLIEHRQD